MNFEQIPHLFVDKQDVLRQSRLKGLKVKQVETLCTTNFALRCLLYYIKKCIFENNWT